MIVVADTTPIIALIKINQLDLLQKLYGNVMIPEAVFEELTCNASFTTEAKLVQRCSFLQVCNITDSGTARILETDVGLDKGESEAIVLYGEQEADLLLVDEHKARSVAKQKGVRHIGTVGVLMMAHDVGILSAHEVEVCIDSMLHSEIRLSSRLCNQVMAYVGLKQKY